MADKKQISATIDLDIANDVSALAENEQRSFSQMVEILLRIALQTKSAKKEKVK